MAKIVLGIGTSHGPMMLMDPEDWNARVEFDKSQIHSFKGESYSFDELVELRKDEGIAKEIELDVQRERLAACNKAVDQLVEAYERVKPDIAVIVGNDQMEAFSHDNMPCMAVYTGEDVVNIPAGPKEIANMPPGIPKAAHGYWGDEGAHWPGQADLGQHIVRHMMQNSFDVSQMTSMPQKSDWMKGVPHAFGYIYQNIMKRNVIPNVPIFINTFYPDNQPTPGRVFDFGRSLREAIESWDSDLTVAVFASGGLTHFVIDEEFDRGILDAMAKNDRDEVVKWPENLYASGSSETKNWLPLASAAGDAGLKMKLVDYVPCYRSLAGTGNAMAFAIWE